MKHPKASKCKTPPSAKSSESPSPQSIRIIPGERASSVCDAHLFEDETDDVEQPSDTPAEQALQAKATKPQSLAKK